MTKEPATDRFAARFHAAEYSVLAFDHRHLGQSGGMPRQVVVFLTGRAATRGSANDPG